MEETLKTLYLRIDRSSRSLTKNALTQLLLKVLYSNDKPITLQEVRDFIDKNLNIKIDKGRIEECLDKLVNDNKINFEHGKYKLYYSERNNIDNKYRRSKNRIEEIVSNHFAPFNSSNKDVIAWLSDVTIEFFNNYSSEWIADLCYDKSTKIKARKEDILQQTLKITRENDKIHEDDIDHLNNKFVECITFKNDPSIYAHLLEYGTSAFASKLIKSSLGADPISISALRGSKCIIDTNVLIEIALELAKYSSSLKKLDEIFQQLHIKSGYLEITEEEYVNTVKYRKYDLKGNFGKCSNNLLKEMNDEFVQAAINMNCSNEEDFDEFWKEINTPPKYMYSDHKIEKFNHSEDLIEAINKAQDSDEKKEKINKLYRKTTGYDKKDKALLHDVGLIAGAEFIKENEKAFILSQEFSINNYSRTKSHSDHLPMSMKLETLINILAIDNGGVDIDPNDFSDLFVNMIRCDLKPDKNTFENADLSRVLDKELKIEELPSNEVVNIATEVHQNRMDGMNEEDIELNLDRSLQKTKHKYVNKYDEKKEELRFERRDKKKYKKKYNKAKSILREEIEKEEYQKYDERVLKSRVIWYIGIPLVLCALIAIGLYILLNKTNISDFMNYFITISSSILIWIFTSLVVIKPKLNSKHE